MIKPSLAFALLSILLLSPIHVALGQDRSNPESTSSHGIPSFPTANSLAQAIMTPATATLFIPGSALISGQAVQFEVFNFPIQGFPRDGSSYAVMSSGRAADAPNADGAIDFHSFNLGGQIVPGGSPDGFTAFDVATLALDFSLPSNARIMSFDFKFCSEESPDWIGTVFQDYFTAAASSPGFGEVGTLVTIDSALFTNLPGGSSPSPSPPFPSPNDVTYNACTDVGSGSLDITSILPGLPGSRVSLAFTIGDASDEIFDSAVFLDQLRIASIGGEVELDDAKAVAQMRADAIDDLELTFKLVNVLSWIITIVTCTTIVLCAAGIVINIGTSAAVSQLGLEEAGDLWQSLADDPPDPQYDIPVFIEPFETINLPDELSVLESFVNNISESSAILRALVIAIERYQGALDAGDISAASLQAHSAREFAAALEASQDQLHESISVLVSLEFLSSTIADNFAELQSRVANDGFSEEELAALRDLGMSAKEIEDLRVFILALETNQLGDLFDFLNSWGQLIEQSTTVLDDLVGQMALVSEEADMQLRELGAGIAEAGPGLTIECNTHDGTSVTLDGSGSFDPEGDPLTYIWMWLVGSATGVMPTVQLPLGDNKIILVVNDGVIDSAPDTVGIKIEDTTPPTIIAPTDVVVVSNTPRGATGVDIGTAIATDTCDSSATITNDGPSTFLLGDTTVVWTAKDDTGNSAIDIQIVTVEALPVDIDTKPGSDPNSINIRSRGTIPVAILSTTDFDAPNQVDKDSITFGRNGNEASLAFCKGAEDVNNDGFLDLVCHFNTRDTGFLLGDTEGTLRGETVEGISIEGRDSVRIIG